jgi:hypothetical protein
VGAADVAEDDVWPALAAVREPACLGGEPAPGRASTTWAAFLRSKVDACDVIETITLTGQRQYVLAVIAHSTRRIRVLGTAAHPNAAWVTQAARNLITDLEGSGTQVKYLIRDRDAEFPVLFDQILADAGIQVVLSGVRMPRMNSIMERWVHKPPPRVARPHPHLERTPPASRPARVRAALQRTPHPSRAPSGHPCTRYPNRSLNEDISPTSTYTEETDSAESSTNTGMSPDLHG